MQAVLKKDPSRIGDIITAYTAPDGQKRLVVDFITNVIDADLNEFDLIFPVNQKTDI